jgi:signal transduction histidine kinase
MRGSLSRRLLMLNVVVVAAMVALIFTPTAAQFRLDFLQERLRMAQIASLAILATPEGALDAVLEGELLARSGAASIVLRRDGARALVLSAVVPEPIDATFDLRAPRPGALVYDALTALAAPPDRHIRVIGLPDPASTDEVEITMDEAPLRAALVAFGQRILLLSFLISLATATMIYALVRRLLVRPIETMVDNMAAFRDDPEDLARVMRPSSRVAEIAKAEVQLAEMQTQVRDSLRERARLAALGEAVAKISHDLRNILSSAQLMADSIEGSRDPMVARIGPKLIGSLDRAIKLCDSTLRYGRAEEAAPVPRRIVLRTLTDEAFDAVFPDRAHPSGLTILNDTPPELVIEADPDQMFRVLVNLLRNARQAIEQSTGRGRIEVVARRGFRGVEIDLRDSGPGLPSKALENLFQPFKGGARKGGSGLGLAIAQELIGLQGGRLELVATTTEGTVFRIALPAAAALQPAEDDGAGRVAPFRRRGEG